jgi:AbiJ N-terminal domain 4
MGIVNLYSKQQKALKGQPPDVYRHDELPKPLRVQIVQIWDDAIGREAGPLSGANFLFEQAHKHLCREYGVQHLWRLPDHPLRMEFARQEVNQFFLNCQQVEQCLDVIQVVFTLAQQHVRLHARDGMFSPTVSCDDAIKELNERFREHGIGFQFHNGQILRIDSRTPDIALAKMSAFCLRTPRERQNAGATGNPESWFWFH